jgi:hypothetical protein
LTISGDTLKVDPIAHPRYIKHIKKT